MATESDVDISGAHPYWAYPFSDIAVVHNGQLTNYHYWSRRLERTGHRFQSECDSEIIAVYLAEKMAEGTDLEDAMRQSLEDLDGVFTYICVTEDALGMAKDELAAKPLVLYEADDLVALASEEIAIRAVVDREIDTYDPYEGEVMVWTSADLRRARPRRARRHARRGIAEIDGGRATFDARGPDDAQDQRRAAPADLRGGHPRRHGPQPGRAALARRRDPAALQDHLRRHARLLRLGLIDGPEVHVKGRVGWSACENMMSRRRRDRRQRRLAHRRRRSAAATCSCTARRRAHGDRPEGRHDHRSATPGR